MELAANHFGFSTSGGEVTSAPSTTEKHELQAAVRDAYLCLPSFTRITSVALAHYLADMGDKVSVSRHGLFVSENHPFVATSTDGLVHGDDEPGTVGVLEIKCPFSDQPLEVLACSRTDFCLEFDGSDFTVKKRHPYYHQLQMEMGITGCKWADLVVFTMTATGPSKQIKHVPFDLTVFNSDRAKAILFYKNFIVLELLTRRVQRRVQLVA